MKRTIISTLGALGLAVAVLAVEPVTPQTTETQTTQTTETKTTQAPAPAKKGPAKHRKVKRHAKKSAAAPAVKEGASAPK